MITKQAKTKGDKIEKILEILQAGAECTADVLDIFTSNYHDSYRKMKRSIHKGSKRFETDWAFEYKRRQQFYSLLNKLKKEKLVESKKINSRSSLWKITREGLEKLKIMKEKKTDCHARFKLS